MRSPRPQLPGARRKQITAARIAKAPEGASKTPEITCQCDHAGCSSRVYRAGVTSLHRFITPDLRLPTTPQDRSTLRNHSRGIIDPLMDDVGADRNQRTPHEVGSTPSRIRGLSPIAPAIRKFLNQVLERICRPCSNVSQTAKTVSL